MGKGGKATQNGVGGHRYFTMEEVKSHNKPDDRWIVVNGQIYNVTEWVKRHPGGARVIGSYSGQDATDVWTAMHDNKEFVSKFMKPLLVGEVKDAEETELEADFRRLRKHVDDSGMLTTEPMFYVWHLVSIIGLEALSYLTFLYFGTGWLPYLAVTLMLVTSQAQAGWLQHDFGHLSVFKSRKLNHIAHHFTIGHLKGASSHWWNFRHFLHHSKPNIILKDPDVEISYLFLLGETLPKYFAQKKRGFMPYNFQHKYFFFLGPPLLLPIYFHFENLYFVIKRRDWVDLVMTITFFMRWFSLFGPFVGGLGAFGLYMFVRFIESHWFTWCTQMSHIPNEVDFDSKDGKDWINLQLDSTCNVDESFFNNWFTGHLNYQIEHHLFPTMPRHNFWKVKPLVESLCKKHNVNYRSKPLLTAFGDIVRSLEKSGELWYHAYYE